MRGGLSQYDEILIGDGRAPQSARAGSRRRLERSLAFLSFHHITMTTLHPQNQHQFSYDDALVSPYSSDYSLSPSDLMSSWDGRFDNSLQLAVHLEHPNYSQHHAGLSNTVDSARWTADYSSVGSNAYLPCPPVGAASVAGAVDLALQQNPSATVGDFLNHLPVHDIHTSPTTSQRRLSIDEQVRTSPTAT